MKNKTIEDHLCTIFNLKEFLQDAEWKDLLDHSVLKSFRKNEIILKRDFRYSDVIFVAEGVLASEFTINEKKVIGRFFQPGNLCTNFDSLLHHTVSRYQIVSITPCTIISIAGSDFMRYYNNGISLGKILRNTVLEIIAEDILITDMKLLYGKSEMIEFIRTHYPDIAKKVPYKYIAQFLGITPEAYSRILKQSHQKSS
ncbi:MULTISPECIES: Crp/Fnr family transcriptional regulator [Chryseobacterium]|uniref:CRP-like cAMP-binding protein n=1 Tax=Chryseobacterium camelliae TaxID=1265445 RepID=A0ABU0THC2_9FLAO|nr:MULTISPECIES: cyclic nucleotide-binding domain-containing protein [Chryseobacterium]MDT3405748.1 CRP-like cAMP-binding protein [Pseudacidovorax intermedius]MDQ1096444.1 CRP-like cAMP-binding protein [Chryseobacterium camelliae]MDQ1100385.1 CRP-like cAMP-binding protein [Chryseobacterium sp. SORGH_AS_1048]MDR6087726.1 CRP-like cAMP-binding protein [Chryseobacterium sp. SORGH_AS_0909]MDR6132101.1 CRP-like cAMP-binding protein [Chryseobacterium sp. SORGH_AS_1175]